MTYSFSHIFLIFFPKEIKIFSDGFMRPPSITYSRMDDVVCEEFFKNSIQYSQNQNLTCFLNQKVYFFWWFYEITFIYIFKELSYIIDFTHILTLKRAGGKGQKMPPPYGFSIFFYFDKISKLWILEPKKGFSDFAYKTRVFSLGAPQNIFLQKNFTGFIYSPIEMI